MWLHLHLSEHFLRPACISTSNYFTFTFAGLLVFFLLTIFFLWLFYFHFCYSDFRFPFNYSLLDNSRFFFSWQSFLSLSDYFTFTISLKFSLSFWLNSHLMLQQFQPPIIVKIAAYEENESEFSLFNLILLFMQKISQWIFQVSVQLLNNNKTK